jgi:hypothetical protein
VPWPALDQSPRGPQGATGRRIEEESRWTADIYTRRDDDGRVLGRGYRESVEDVLSYAHAAARHKGWTGKVGPASQCCVCLWAHGVRDMLSRPVPASV